MLKNLQIPDNVEIPYPDDELKDLRRCIKLQGFIALAVKETGLSKNTIKAYPTKKQGVSEKVNALRSFVKSFLDKAAQPAA